MQDRAWLVAYLEKNGRYRLTTVSEQHPTMLGAQWVAQVMAAPGNDYASARKNLLRKIRQELPIEVAQYGDNDVRVAKGLASLSPQQQRAKQQRAMRV